MELSTFEQIFDQLTKATKILIALPSVLTADNTASALALFLFLRKMSKEVEIVTSATPPQSLSFLPGFSSIKNSLSTANSLVISVSTVHTQVDEVSYDSKGDKLNIFVKPKSGTFTPADVTFSADQSPYQVIIVIDCASLENLGQLFEQHADVFFNSPKINIDNKATNEYFGAINLVDINATSIAEILADLLATYEEQLIDEDIATALLTGIITKTNSFQHIHTTPKSFVKASELVSLGGRQQEVIKFLYKTKPLSVLRLWGRALARLKTTDHSPVLYSLLGRSDFEKSEAQNTEALPVLRELVDNISNYKIVGLLYEQAGGGIKILLAAHPQVEIESLEKGLGVPARPIQSPLGTFLVFEFTLPEISLQNAEEKFVKVIEEKPLG